MSQNVIELNGKCYDANTGALLGKSTARAVTHLAKHAATPPPGRVVDGFFRQPKIAKPAVRHKAPAAAAPKPAPAAASKPTPKPKAVAAAKPHAVKKPAVPTAVQHHAGHAHLHAPGKEAHRHQPQHSKTLMRGVVHKPETHIKPAIRPQAPAEIAARPASALAPKRSVAQVDPGRLERAKATAKHNAIRHFQPASYGAATLRHTVQPASGHVPVIPVRDHPAPHAQHTPTPKPADIFEAAIRHAHSHEQPLFKHPRKRRRFTSIAAGIAALLVLGGFITYLNLPNIQLHIASVEAGFHASMPSYRPTGYALKGGVEHHGGTVTMRFTSGDSSYQITQQSSSWDSQALLDDTMALSGSHQTIQRGGRTIYVYGDGANASWVTGNVRYDITGSASLSPDELANIAASM